MRSVVVALALVVGILAVRQVVVARTGSDRVTPAGARIDAANRPGGTLGHTTSTRVNHPAKPRGARSSREAKRPVPFHVVAGPVIVHKSAAQLAAQKAAEKAARVAARAARMAARSFTFTIGTFNVLGSQHSTRTGDHSSYPPASQRSVGAAGLIREHGVDVLGTQELKPDQLNALQRMTGMAAYPGYAFGSRNTDNSILYNPSKFAFVSGTSFPVKFMNAVRPQTVLRLRDRATGREAYFVNMHVSAITAPRYAPSQRAGHYAGAAEVNKLKADGIPIFLTGDMNDRAGFFCRVVPLTHMVAAGGGDDIGGCHPGTRLDVDWILGTQDIAFSHYWQDRTPIHHISDHFFISAVADVGSGPLG